MHLIFGFLNWPSKFNRSMDEDEYGKQEKYCVAADVRVELDDAHVRDLQSKYLKRFRAGLSKLCSSMIIMHPNYGLVLFVLSVKHHIHVCYGLKSASQMRWLPLTFVAGIRCANIDYCSFATAVTQFMFDK